MNTRCAGTDPLRAAVNTGAVFDAITTRDFDSEQIMKLSDDDAKAFLCVAEPMFQEMLNNCLLYTSRCV